MLFQHMSFPSKTMQIVCITSSVPVMTSSVVVMASSVAMVIPGHGLNYNNKMAANKEKCLFTF